MGRRALYCRGPACRLGLVSDVFSRSRVCRPSPYHLAMPPRKVCGAESNSAGANENPAAKGHEDPRRATPSHDSSTVSACELVLAAERQPTALNVAALLRAQRVGPARRDRYHAHLPTRDAPASGEPERLLAHGVTPGAADVPRQEEREQQD